MDVSLWPCSIHLSILSPSLPHLAPRILILALLDFHLSAQASLVHISAITGICWLFYSPRLLCLSFSWAPYTCQLMLHAVLPREGAIMSTHTKSRFLLARLGGHKGAGGSGCLIGVYWGWADCCGC